MKRPLILLKSGKLKREANTLVFITEEENKKVVPVNGISEIEVFGELEINKRALEFLTYHKIPVHFYNHYGYYVGTYYPREHLNSGYIILKQAEHRLNPELRIHLAKSFVIGAAMNIIKNLKSYASKFPNIEEVIGEINTLLKQVNKAKDIQSLMAIEGNVRELYYSSFSIFLKNFSFAKRTKRPPLDEINALISFGNTLLYARVLSEIYSTHLDPRIGYLHETNMRSFNLNLDIAEIFKPIIVDRVIFSLINKGSLKETHFEKEVGICYLNKEGKEKFIRAFEEKLSSTIKHRKLGKKVSFRRLIRLECYKLIKHLIGDETYTPFIMWW
ncbi:type I-B CRISPR-associated endonuclease Cas1b [Thermovibrio sp.]